MKLNEWHNSSNGNGSCVEVMETEHGFLVRDTKDDESGPVHTFTPDEWRAFLAGVKRGEYDPAE